MEKRNPSESEIETLFFIPDEKDIKKTVAFFEVFNEFIASNKSEKAQRTIMGYQTIFNYLKIFEKTTGYKITWDTLNLKFLDQLKKYHFETFGENKPVILQNFKEC